MNKQRLRNGNVWIKIQIYGYTFSVWNGKKVLEMNGGDGHISM